MRILPLLLVAALATAAPAHAQVLAEAIPARIGLTLARGDSARREIAVANHGMEPIVVEVRYSDWTMDERGALALVKPGRVTASLEGQIGCAPSRFTVAPGDTGRVTVTLHMPNYGPATRWGVLLSQVRPADAADAPGPGAALGTTLYVSSLPPDDIRPEIEAIDVMPLGPDSVGVRVRLRNPGGRHFHAGAEVAIRDLDGTTLAAGKLPVAVVLPELSRDAIYACHVPLPAGRYRAAVALDAGLPQRVEAEIAFDWPPAASARLEKP